MTDGAADAPAPPGEDAVWGIETNGINSIPDDQRHGRPAELFSIWFAANVSVLAVAYGGYLIVFFGLDLWQAAVAAAVGAVVSFLIVGLIGLAGKRGGAPTLILSRAAFGIVGNVVPTIVSYVTLVGFEIISASLAALAVQTVLGRFDVGTGTTTLAVAFAITAGVAVAVSVCGHATIVRVQRWFTIAFALLTAIFVVIELTRIDWQKVGSLPPGHLLSGLIAGLSIVMAGTGITWVNAAADYTRYLSRRASSAAVVSWTVAGSSLPLVVLIVLGALLAANDATIATSSNPIGVLASALPTWFLGPYMVTAVGGLIATVLMSSYSSGLNLLTLGISIPRYKSVAFDSVLMIAGGTYILFFAPSFFAPFQGFLVTVSVPLAGWAAIFLVDLGLYRRDGYVQSDLYRRSGIYGAVNVPGLAALVVASVVGLGLVTSTSAVFGWAGYLLPLVGGRNGAVGSSSIGLIVGFVVAGILYGSLGRLSPGRSTRRVAM